MVMTPIRDLYAPIDATKDVRLRGWKKAANWHSTEPAMSRARRPVLLC